MTYNVKGKIVTLQLSAEEVNQTIEAVEQLHGDCELLQGWYQFREREFGKPAPASAPPDTSSPSSPLPAHAVATKV